MKISKMTRQHFQQAVYRKENVCVAWISNKKNLQKKKKKYVVFGYLKIIV